MAGAFHAPLLQASLEARLNRAFLRLWSQFWANIRQRTVESTSTEAPQPRPQRHLYTAQYATCCSTRALTVRRKWNRRKLHYWRPSSASSRHLPSPRSTQSQFPWLSPHPQTYDIYRREHSEERIWDPVAVAGRSWTCGIGALNHLEVWGWRSDFDCCRALGLLPYHWRACCVKGID
ncbi:Hypothetical predicted protein [Pelobates cultripes]|uniref:Uncharacterized protein n=1 Tax=Pelobates cultripes TaxID=61616 RepID=A0AAD1RXB1_PELCU|nr:Hypothetical predicted protein [Pelobates cultripes]